MTNQTNRPHPGVMPDMGQWDPDENRLPPLPVSGMSDHDREAELRRGLAQRVYDLQQSDELDRRMTWQELYDMFYAAGRVSKATASKWADTITARGVRRR